jgi:hypothetical protein
MDLSAESGLALRQLVRDLREVPKPGGPLGQVPLEPPHRRPLVLRRSTLRVEVDELQEVVEWEVRKLTRCVLGHP